MTEEYELLNKLKEVLRESRRVAITCFGKDLRGDDAVGPYICRELMKKGLNNVVVCDDDIITCLYEAITIYKPLTLILIDAVDLSLKPGTIVLTPLENIEEVGISTSTHNLPIRTIVEFIKTLVGVDLKTLVIGIQVSNLDLTQQISEEVIKSANTIVNTLTSLTGGLNSRWSTTHKTPTDRTDNT